MLTLGVVLTLGPTVSAARADEDEDGAVAPPDSWVCVGGSPARTGVARTAPVRGAIEVAWEYRAKGTLEGEPLVYRDDVILSELRDGRRTLVFVSLADGSVLAEKRLQTSAPLQLVLWNGVVYVVGDDQQLQAYERRDKTVARVWYSDSDAGKHAISLIAFGRELYVLTANSLERYDRPKREASWIKLGRFRGELALRGEHVYAVGYDDDGNAKLHAFARDGKGRETQTGIGHHNGAVPDGRAAIELRVHGRTAFVRHSLPVPIVGSGSALLANVNRRVVGGGAVLLEETGFWKDGFPSVPYGDEWVGLLNSQKHGLVLARVGVDDASLMLATDEWNSEFLKGSDRPSRAGDVIYLSGRAIDIATENVLWRTPHVGDFRAIPASGTVLLPVSARRIVAIRGKGDSRPRDSATLLVTPEGERVAIDRLVTRAHSVLGGPLSLDAARGQITGGGSTTSLDDVLVAVDADGSVRCASTGPEVAEALRLLADRKVGKQFADLAARAAKAFDGDLARRLLAEGTRRGAPRAPVAAAEKRIRGLAKLRRMPEPKAAEVRAVLEAERAVLAELDGVVWQAYEKLPDGATLALRLDLLRDVLEREPARADAHAAVRALLPESVQVKEPFSGLAWLPFIEAIQHSPVRVRLPPSRDTAELTPGERILGATSHTWRRDIVGVESRQLLIITPMASPERLARCLSLGELVCDRLEEFFAGGKRKRTSRYPLIVQLFDTEEAYREASRVGGKPDHVSEWSAGHYDPNDEISRMYLPEDDAEFRRVMSVFAHELTHQWIDERCPLFTAADNSGDPTKTPGHWVVEGIAEMVEGMQFDLRARTWTPDPRSDSLQIVSAIESKHLIPWKQLVDGTYADFALLPREGKLTVHSPQRLGTGWVMSPTHVYYAQAGAICQFLYMVDDGKHRTQLAEYVGARYRGETPPFADHFGMTPAELGKRLIEFARSFEGDDL